MWNLNEHFSFSFLVSQSTLHPFNFENEWHKSKETHIIWVRLFFFRHEILERCSLFIDFNFDTIAVCPEVIYHVNVI